MSRNTYIFPLVCAVLALSGGVSRAQTPQARDAWLMKNYRFAGPPPPGSIRPTDPVISDLQRIQNTVLSIMRKANFAEDWETALVAAGQAAANAQLIGVITQRLESANAAKSGAGEAMANAPVYAIALKDHTIESAIVYWTDQSMLHYMTPQGSHVQVRLDLVDRGLSARLNQQKGLEFRLPE
jgi:hypothetical protein